MVKVISRDELLKLKSSEARLKVVDVLTRESYSKEHIEGAISLPLSEIEKRAAKILDKDDTIVVYCASFECQASTMAAEKLMAMGYKKVLDYKGGLKDYKAADLPLEGELPLKREKASCPFC